MRKTFVNMSGPRSVLCLRSAVWQLAAYIYIPYWNWYFPLWVVRVIVSSSLFRFNEKKWPLSSRSTPWSIASLICGTPCSVSRINRPLPPEALLTRKKKQNGEHSVKDLPANHSRFLHPFMLQKESLCPKAKLTWSVKVRKHKLVSTLKVPTQGKTCFLSFSLHFFRWKRNTRTNNNNIW